MGERLVLRQSRKKISLDVLASLAFVALGAWMVSAPEAGWRASPELVSLIGWASIVLFGGIGLVAVYGLFRPTQVVLDAEGFQVLGLRKRPRVPWTEIGQFFICQVQRTKVVCYERNLPQTDFQRARGMPRAGRWGDGQIPSHLELQPDKVVALLEDWRGRYAG